MSKILSESVCFDINETAIERLLRLFNKLFARKLGFIFKLNSSSSRSQKSESGASKVPEALLNIIESPHLEVSAAVYFSKGLASRKFIASSIFDFPDADFRDILEELFNLNIKAQKR